MNPSHRLPCLTLTEVIIKDILKWVIKMVTSASDQSEMVTAMLHIMQ